MRSAAKRSAAEDFGEAATSATSKTQTHEGDSRPNAHSPQAAMIKDKDKRKLVKAGSPKGARPKVKGKGKRDMMHPRPEENLDNDWEDEARPLNETREETNEETLPSEGKDNNNIVEQLKWEIQSLKSRCDWQEKTIEDLKSRCDSHEKVLETLRQEIIMCMGAVGRYKLVCRMRIGQCKFISRICTHELRANNTDMSAMGQYELVGRFHTWEKWANTVFRQDTCMGAVG
ncbi:hypothetical protein EDB84DRAFT_1442867 [Lactarius hengduanensis]|nr:hypothetical protein EDB84DRAFT_1442867 [Lactarius hengduanensis]